jgi:uncharacterized protein (DUF1499 family)
MTQINLSKCAAALLLTASVLIGGCSSNPVAKGIVDGNLADCPSSPNCITSNASDADKQYDAFRYQGSPVQAKNKLLNVLKEFSNTNLITVDENYIHAEFTTSIMRFVDDGEFLLEDGAIQVRSASRTGYSDFGKNRSRMDDIKQAFEPCCN